MTGIRWSEEDLAAFEKRQIYRRHGIPTDDELRPAAHPTPRGDRPAPASRAAEAEIAAQPSKLQPSTGSFAGGGEPAQNSPRPSKRKRPEQDLQKAAVKLLESALPPEWRVVHVPNGGWRSAIEAAIMSAMGVRRGFPDLAVLRPREGDHAGGLALAIEFKAGKGRLSEDQADWRDWFIRHGMSWALCRSIDDVIAACEDAGVPLRVRT